MDENIPDDQRQLLYGRHIQSYQIGHEIGCKGMKDSEIIPFLLGLPAPTFFTRDKGFYNRRLCHSRFCIICLAVGQHEVADFVYRILKHSDLYTKAKRMGKVILATHAGIRILKVKSTKETCAVWTCSRQKQ
ncbi:MAG: hypothetical protein HZA48_11735 [Planctomycetes bacterium]|nr:hypothetical protein [Planctomycetota bacterium]